MEKSRQRPSLPNLCQPFWWFCENIFKEIICVKFAVMSLNLCLQLPNFTSTQTTPSPQYGIKHMFDKYSCFLVFFTVHLLYRVRMFTFIIVVCLCLTCLYLFLLFCNIKSKSRFFTWIFIIRVFVCRVFLPEAAKMRAGQLLPRNRRSPDWEGE